MTSSEERVPGFFGMNRTQAALSALAVFVFAPLPGLIRGLREGDVVAIFLATLFLILGPLPSLGIWRGKRWAHIAGLYVCWPSLITIIVRGMRHGFSIPWDVAAAGLCIALIVAFNFSRPARADLQEKRENESFPRWLKENGEAIVVAFIMALVIRCFCIEVFKIPSSSMEPTLLGDVNRDHPIDGDSGCPFRDEHFPGGGDRIMVTKYYYDFSDIERFDVVVFKFPLNQSKNFIKRVVGLPNEELKIWKGDLYARPKGREKFAIVRRPLRIQDSIWISAAGAGRMLRDAQTFQSHWDTLPSSGSAQHTLLDEELATQEAGGERGVKFLFTPPISDGQGAVGDVHVAFDFELTSPRGRLFAEVTNSHGTFELSLETDGESQLRAYAPGGGKSQPTRRVALKNNFHPVMDRRYKLDLAVYDGMAIARINGEVLADLTFLAFREEETRERESGNTLISFGSHEVTFKARNLKVGRDIYYRPARSSYDFGLKEDTAVEIPDGQYLMMGDNVANSHDSRAWVEVVFKLKDGREIVCENQEINKHETQMRIKEKLGLDRLPDYVIEADRNGNEIFFSQKEIEGGGPTKREFRFVDRKYIVGKGLWIWWPQGRWFHLIR